MYTTKEFRHLLLLINWYTSYNILSSMSSTESIYVGKNTIYLKDKLKL